jgi:hypothetical protein
MAENRRISVQDVEDLVSSNGRPMVLTTSHESMGQKDETVNAGFQLKTLLVLLAIVVILRTDNPVSNLIDNVVISPLEKRARTGTTVLKPVVSIARVILPVRRKRLPLLGKGGKRVYEEGQY